MTRDILLNSICPMSRVYDCCIADGDYDCDNCKRLTNEWFDEYDKQIRAEAIDKLSSIVLKELREIAKDEDYYFDNDNLILVSSVILTNAEKLKEQK